MKIIVTVCFVLCLAGCATQQDYLASLQTYNGLPESALIDKFGVPDKSYQLDGRTYLAFITRRSQYEPADTGFYGATRYNRSAFSTGIGDVNSRYRVSECENTFVIYQGRVEKSGFKGECY